MNCIIKEAHSDDEIRGKAFVHYTSWNETYTGLMPQEFLDGRSLEKCERFALKFPQNTLVAVAEGEVVGFANYLPESRDFSSVKPSSELVALYVLQKYQRCGIGKALLNKCLELLPSSSVVLFVLEGNQNAIGFYERIGFSFTGHKLSQNVPGGEISELEMLLER